MTCVLLAVCLSAVLSRQVFERLPHLEDEMAYLWQAKLLASGQLTISPPEPRRAFWQPFVVDYTDPVSGESSRFGKYTLGWPLLLSLGVLMGAPWLINTLLSGLTVALTYRLGREIFSPSVGAIAAALTAFSPMALLLNATLMGHTAALFTTTLFLYACWRMVRGRRAFRWGLLAGLALGLTVLNRPLAGLALGIPFIAWSLARLVATALQPNPARRFALTLAPLMALTAVAGLLTLLIPAYNGVATGTPSLNLYTLVWSYDRVGFGDGYGRNIHTLEKGLRQTRWDLSLTGADLFGWQLWLTRDAGGGLGLRSTLATDGGFDPELRQHLLNDGDYWSPLGLSLILLLPGLWLGTRGSPNFRLILLAWLLLGLGAGVWSVNRPPADLQDPAFAYGWMLAAGLWLIAPCALLAVSRADDRATWSYLLLAVGLALIWLHIAYWIGSQRFSTRYYFEMLSGFAILSAVPLAALGRLIGGRWLAGGLALLLLGSLFTYSLPRISVLYRFNWMSPVILEALEPLRDGRPLLVIVRGEDIRWRGVGPLMSVTNPLLTSDIVLAIDNGLSDTRATLLDRFPERQVIDMTGALNRVCLGEGMEAGPCFGAPPGQ
jgi:4-amino-4-deoxy-L-arabinose transferase-like glycosyltransferase